MSLINDALKRAKKAQQDNPRTSPPPLQFLAATPSAPRHSGPFILVLLALVVLVIAGGLLLWTLAKQSAPGLRVEARTMTPPAPAILPVSQAKVVLPAPPEPAAAEPAGEPIQPAQVTTDETLPGQPVTNGLPVAAAVAPPQPAALKLQAILYNPNRPLAILSGKTVFLGDRVGEFRVLAMTQSSVTIGSATVTNVLSLGE